MDMYPQGCCTDSAEKGIRLFCVGLRVRRSKHAKHLFGCAMVSGRNIENVAFRSQSSSCVYFRGGTMRLFV